MHVCTAGLCVSVSGWVCACTRGRVCVCERGSVSALDYYFFVGKKNLGNLGQVTVLLG